MGRRCHGIVQQSDPKNMPFNDSIDLCSACRQADNLTIVGVKSKDESHHEPDIERMSEKAGWRTRPTSPPKTVGWRFAAVNLSLLLVLMILLVLCPKPPYLEGSVPPYSKAREDGAVKLVNKRFKPQPLFQSEPSDEVDAAWNKTMEYDNTIGLTRDFAEKHGLPRSIPSAHDPKVRIYGISVFHQLHCLNILRQSLYPDRYMKDISQENIRFHHNHCFDFLRQAIMCKADVSMIYWWNKNYTTVEEDGTTRDSDYYLSLNGGERERQSFVKWDVEHQCHDLDRIVEWLDENRIDRHW